MGTSDYAASVTLQKDVVALTGGIRFATFNSPFTHSLPNQVLLHESVAADFEFGLPGSLVRDRLACI